MEAMILAAGHGTRLRPLTDGIPKALVEVGGRPLVARVLGRMAGAGFRRVVLNVHHHEAQIRAYLQDHPPAGMEILFSPEPDGPYDTGGGLFAARHLFRESSPFLLHNVDVLSAIPLDQLLASHQRAAARTPDGIAASLAVQERPARRSLLFDEEGLVGWENLGSDRAPEGHREVREPVGALRRLAFTGIHVVDPRIFDLSPRRGTFSIIDLYLELASQGHRIRPLDVTGHPWIDVGTPERLREAEAFLDRMV